MQAISVLLPFANMYSNILYVFILNNIPTNTTIRLPSQAEIIMLCSILSDLVVILDGLIKKHDYLFDPNP